MGETTTVSKPKKRSWFRGLKFEFKKIIWADKSTLVKESAAVLVISIVLGLLIAVVDAGAKYGIELLI